MDEHEEINYKTLRKIQQAEQNSAALTKIHVDFYKDLTSYITSIDLSVENEKNPLKLKLFREEAQNTKKIGNSIYELREKKIVQAALATARGAIPDLKNLIEIEKKLYDALVEQIMFSRQNIFKKTADFHSKTFPISTSVIDEPKRNSNTNPIVRVMQDTPEFVGIDEKTYLLRKEDVLSLPRQMTEPLIKKEVVKQVK